jgi:hypothetical protein
MPSVAMLIVMMLGVTMLNVLMTSVVMLIAIMLSVAMLNVMMLSVAMLNFLMKSVTMLNFLMPSVAMLNVMVLSVTMLIVMMPSVAAPFSVIITKILDNCRHHIFEICTLTVCLQFLQKIGTMLKTTNLKTILLIIFWNKNVFPFLLISFYFIL